MKLPGKSINFTANQSKALRECRQQGAHDGMSHAHIPAARKGSDSEIIALSRQAAKDLVQVPSSRARSKSMDESQMEDESDCDSNRLRMIEARLFELNSEAFGRAHERDDF